MTWKRISRAHAPHSASPTPHYLRRDGGIRTTERWMVIVARRQRLSLTAHPLPSVYPTLEPLPFNAHFQFNCSHGDLIARTLYKDFKPVQTAVERVTSESLTHLHVFPPYANARSENRVVWSCMDSSFLLCATASGIWTGYDLFTEPAPSFYRWRIDPLYESGLTIGCCANCFLAVVGKVGYPTRTTLWIFEALVHLVS